MPPVDRLRRLLFISFIESFTTILVERGVYFYSFQQLHFGNRANLLLALGIGVGYVTGALSSHRLARALTEKRMLVLLLIGHVISHVTLAAVPQVVPFVGVNLVLAMLTGAKWPVLESYVSAGCDAAQTARRVGLFSLAWSLSVPLGLAVVGPLVKFGGWPLFATAAGVNLVTLALLIPLDRAPAHLPPGHSQRPPEATLARYRRLQLSSRLSMLGSYTLLFLLVPLMPAIFKNLGYIVAAPALTALIEVTRFLTFLAMFIYAGWVGRSSVLVWAALAMPVSFVAVLAGVSLPVVLVGELVFGAAAGAVYYSALYYAMVVANASVESGGAHESLVGGGFAIGPLLGLCGVWLAPHLSSQTAGVLVVAGPVTLVGLAWALWALRPLPVTPPAVQGT